MSYRMVSRCLSFVVFSGSILFVGFVATGCGGSDWDDSNDYSNDSNDSNEYEEPECYGHSDCGDDEVCVDDSCVELDETDYTLEILDGEAPDREQWIVQVYEEDSYELFETTSTPPTTEPVWEEETELEVYNKTDWWTIGMTSEEYREEEGDGAGYFGCQIEVEKDQVDGSFFQCGDDDFHFSFMIEPVE